LQPLAGEGAAHDAVELHRHLAHLHQRGDAVQDRRTGGGSVDARIGEERHHDAAGRDHHLGAGIRAGFGCCLELADEVALNIQVLEALVEIEDAVDLHAVDGGKSILEAVVHHVLDDARRELLIDGYQREIRPHHAGRVQAGLAQSEHRDVGDLAAFAQARVRDVADQEGVEATLEGGVHVLHHLAGLEIFEIAVLVGEAADFGDAVHLDLGFGIFDLIEDAAQIFWIGFPLRLEAAHALVPDLHSHRSLLRRWLVDDCRAAPRQPVRRQCAGNWRPNLQHRPG